MKREKIILNSVDVYNKSYGLPTLHPLVSVIDLKNATRRLNHFDVQYEVYALFLKNDANCTLKYGRRQYDFQEGTVVSFAPGRLIEVDIPDNAPKPDAVGLMFHPDLIYGTPLAEKIKRFGFFDYTQMEAVHLSETERQCFLSCLSRIDQEIKHPIDNHSTALIVASIQLLLEYVDRFYDRQFITRHKVNSEVLSQFEQHLKAYYDERAGGAFDAHREGGAFDAHRREGENTMPTVAYFASLVHLSPGYFGDLIRQETGLSPKDLIARHLVSVAKHRLSISNDDVSQIAYRLGFEHPAHFSRMFKRHTGLTPTQYRDKQ